MLFSLEILIKEEDFQKVKISEVLVEWGGKKYHQDPPRYTYDSLLDLDVFPDLNYYKKYFSHIIEDDFNIYEFKAFCLLGNNMVDVERLAYFDSPDLYNHNVFKLLNDVCALDKYAIFMQCDEEYLEKRYRVTSKDNLIDIFCNVLKSDTFKGALITKL